MPKTTAPKLLSLQSAHFLKEVLKIKRAFMPASGDAEFRYKVSPLLTHDKEGNQEIVGHVAIVHDVLNGQYWAVTRPAGEAPGIEELP